MIRKKRGTMVLLTSSAGPKTPLKADGKEVVRESLRSFRKCPKVGQEERSMLTSWASCDILIPANI